MFMHQINMNVGQEARNPRAIGGRNALRVAGWAVTAFELPIRIAGRKQWAARAGLRMAGRHAGRPWAGWNRCRPRGLAAA